MLYTACGFFSLTLTLKGTGVDGRDILVRNSGQLSQLSRHASSIFGMNTHTATFLLASP